MDLRPISTQGIEAVTPPATLGAVPDLRWIDVASLVVDPSYQRDVRDAGRKNVRSIAADFAWAKFSPLVVAPVAGGKYAVIDGQHRATAAALIGITSVPAQIVVADRDTQAAAFVSINAQTTRVLRLSIFRARVAAGDPEASAIVAPAKEAGVTLCRYPKRKDDQKPGETMAIGAVETIWRAGGRTLTVAVLKAVRRATGDAPGAILPQFILALGAVLADHAEWLASPRLLATMEAFDFEGGLEDARAEAVRRRGVSPSDLLQAKIIDHLEKELG